ncbi:RNA polymerase sigma factor, sigma-70 family [Anaerovibrio lipolyticus DSM 3074]|uniref:RNA polymerase sigma factor, sigma-70 family n=1 Tax=Anaerovibrio lipolyticus DSM 3074 TaxID=1120997 RepID=A0A1M6CNL4_9FIRM|nr:sigma factor-like helix-turn-helix DNA-binding protein [Anaerovibrio lipolyticus]SHI62308.1 RNA polymerase sigma factor, sigma-70 family [Anaerovibrio lipolyticus DSM 3074]
MRKLQLKIDKIERCIDNLPDEEKEAIILYYIEKKKYERISQDMNISYSTIRRRVVTGTRAIAVMLFGEIAARKIHFIN